MIYKWVWADGNIALGNGAGATHHGQMLEQLWDQQGSISNYCGGTFVEDDFSGPQFDKIRITWPGEGVVPSPDQIKYQIQEKLHRLDDKEAMYRQRLALVNPVSYQFIPFTQQELANYDSTAPDEKILWNYRARRLNNRGIKAGLSQDQRVNGRELWALMNRFEGHCAYCNKPLDWTRNGTGTWDHVHSLSLGGAGDASNLLPSCANCNSDLNEWDQSLNPERGFNYKPLWIPPEADNLDLRNIAGVEDTEPMGLDVGFLRNPHKMLYPPVFQGTNDITMEANHKIKAHVLNQLELNHYPGADQWIAFSVYGSGISYNWDEAGDFDVQMWVDVTKYNEKYPTEPTTADELVAEVRRIVQMVNFPQFSDLGLTADGSDGVDGATGSMTIQYYPKPGVGSKEENLASKPYACYDLDNDEWLQRPRKLTPTFYGEHFLMVMTKAQDIAIQAESLLEELQRNTISWQFWTQLYKQHHNDKYEETANDAKRNAEAEKLGVIQLFKGVFGGRAEAYSPEGQGIDDERDIVQKYLEVWGVFQRLRHFAQQALPWEEQDIPPEPKEGSFFHKFADWSQIMQDAQALRDSGSVQITANGGQHVEGTVASQSEPGQVYETSFDRTDPNSQAITTWNCSCPWGEVSWGRTRQWKKYEGRPCKHLLALYWTSLNQPLDEARPEAQGQGQLFNPQDLMNPGGMQSSPVPGGPNQGPPAAPMAPAAPQTAPPAMPAMSPAPQPSHLTQPGEGGTAAIPGALSKKLSVTNIYWHVAPQSARSSIERNGFPEGTYLFVNEDQADEWWDDQENGQGRPSDIWMIKTDVPVEENEGWYGTYISRNGIPPEGLTHIGKPRIAKTTSFQNGQVVSAKEPMRGIDRDGTMHTVPVGSLGEVLWSDDSETIAIFPLESGILEPHLVRVQALSQFFRPSKAPTPFVRRK